MSRPKSEKRRRTNTVGIRVSDDEREQIQAFAADHNWTVSKALLVCFQAQQAQEIAATVSQHERENRAELRLAATS